MCPWREDLLALMQRIITGAFILSLSVPLFKKGAAFQERGNDNLLSRRVVISGKQVPLLTIYRNPQTLLKTVHSKLHDRRLACGCCGRRIAEYLLESYHRLIWGECGFGEALAPVYGQPGACYLDPGIHMIHHLQLPGRNLRQKDLPTTLSSKGCRN